ncbi:hypothetical protein P280DRAFT_178772 [Massarina eburnea CBS 473.64]|uniref:Uncharacterized protein n=1 Tax=Massarina eburnea CBS 473.64 TaxID=1395130 RepID=A0A6A6SC23_9PLEO|nr:hypothetical protein P280DRAFT_178772 [Massarina eburnea CBS 473.64]
MGWMRRASSGKKLAWARPYCERRDQTRMCLRRRIGLMQWFRRRKKGGMLRAQKCCTADRRSRENRKSV